MRIDGQTSHFRDHGKVVRKYTCLLEFKIKKNLISQYASKCIFLSNIRNFWCKKENGILRAKKCGKIIEISRQPKGKKFDLEHFRQFDSRPLFRHENSA